MSTTSSKAAPASSISSAPAPASSRPRAGRSSTSAAAAPASSRSPSAPRSTPPATTAHGVLVHQSLRRLRVRLHLLLRARYPPLRHGAPRRRRQRSRCPPGRRSRSASSSRPTSSRCWPAPSIPPGSAGHSLVIGTATDPLSAGRAEVPAHPPGARGAARGFRGLTLGSSPSRRSSRATWTCSQQPRRAARGQRQLLPRHRSIPGSLRRLEPRSPAARTRGSARSAPSRAAGIDAGLLIAPILPGITDSRASLASSWKRRGKRARATWSGRRSASAPRRGPLPSPPRTRISPRSPRATSGTTRGATRREPGLQAGA